MSSSTETNPPRDALSKLRINRDAEPSRSRGRSLWKLVLGLGILPLLAWLGFVGMQAAGWVENWTAMADVIRARTEVRVGTVAKETGRSADALVVATGYLESRRQAKIGARATGRIEVIHIEEGSVVKEDELLAVLEHADLDAVVAATKATLARAKAEAAEQQVEIARSRNDLDRAEKLVVDRSVSEANYDIARFQYQAAVARAESLKAAVALAAARVREAEQLKENMFIRAPFDGTVISKDAEVGESIMPGGMGEASGRGSVATIADLEHLQVACDVKEDYIGRIKLGQSAEVAVDAVPDRRYQGRVRKIVPMGDRARATIKVKVEILDVDGRLFPEMSSTAYFLPEETEEAGTDETRVFCPKAAIVAGESGSFVWVVAEDRLKQVDIVIGAEQDRRSEITLGLSGGERVVLDPDAALHEGQLVKVEE